MTMCSKIDVCPKIAMVFDRDLTDCQYTEAIRAICEKCDEYEPKSKG